MNGNVGDPLTDRSQEKPPVPAEQNFPMASEGERLAGVPKEYSGWDVYNNEAKKVDTELVNDWRESLNSLLLFAAIFAAVLTAFIVESKNMLEPDQGEIMVDVMIFLTNNFANGNHTPYSREQFHPSTLSITINCLFFASLSASLVAALASVVALQWVADYDAAITRGGSSPEDRAKRRQFRYAGVVWWRMSEIITALPLLLYCSVVVFLAGLIIWIWSLHYVVGWVVAGGTALAVLFYSVPMFLSIVFVSAPFRTPLGRWIYIISHFWFSTVYVLARALRIPSVAAWFERAHNTYAASRKREDREVDKRSELGMAALVWLANHLSISQDSYDRLLLLVGELPKLSVGKSSPVSLGDAPWFFIFDLLGWKNLKTDEDHSVSRQEIHSIRILAQLYQMPEVQDIIGPIHEFLYFSDESDEEYWLQYCDKKTSQWSPKARPNTPNSLFLLLRDIPLHSTGTDGEIQLVISLSRWRNSAHALPKPQENIQDNPSVSNPSTVVITDRFLREDMLHSWTSRDTEYLFFTIVQRIIGTVVDSSGEIQPTFLDRLRLYFEATILGNNFNSATTLCLSIPIVYRDLLRDTTVERVKVHHAFTLLLARNLKYYFGNEKVRKVKEVITMLWASPINRGDFETSHLAREFEMEKFFDANKKQMMTWVVNADEIGHIGEILEHLAVAQTSQPDIGPLWRVTASTADADPHFVEAMQAFEYIIRSGSDISPAIHRTLIDLLCRDIELGPLEVFTTSPTISGLASLSGWFIDPCLKFLAQYVERMGKRSFNTPRAEIGNPLEDSWARIATYLIEHDSGTDLWLVQLQASLWHALPDRGEAMCGRAFREPRTLLECIFEYPIECPDHYDTESHILLHLLANMENLIFPGSYPAFKAVPLQGRSVDAVAALLILSDEPDELPPRILERPIDVRCWQMIRGIFNRATASQFCILALLYSVLRRMLTYGGVCSEEMALVVICVTKALELPRDDRSLPIIRPVTRLILDVRAAMVLSGFRSLEETSTVAAMGIRCVDQLNTQLAIMTIFGGQNCRALSCARSREPYSPAFGWLAEYVG